ncbi:MAG: YjbH domain-containing protein [Proteobacteria bacterium]|nr:YjbH domain-containing protein [Pseudomonadota bacterium]MBU4580928.1 YjbH domain-containing protein [Pseudomonadota bacterium]
MRLLRFARKDTRKVRKDKGDVTPFFVILLLLLLIGTAAAGDEPFDGPANWGGTGLMEIPTARVMRQGRFRVGASQIDPYRYYHISVSPLEGLEIGGRVTEVMGVGALSADYGNTKDKAIDLKYRVLPEGKWWPAVAVGIMDPHGTRVYPAQYLVASKQIYPFDFTIGFGNGRFGKRPLPGQGEGIAVEMFEDNASWRQDGQFFWGVQFALSEEVMLMAEYSPIRYEVQTGDPAQAKYFTEAVPSKYNFGLRWRPWSWLEADLSWQRGNQIGVGLSAAFDLGVPMIPLYDHPYREKPEHRLSPVEERIARGLAATGFSDIIVRKGGDVLAVEARNDKYFYTPRALSVMLRVVAGLAPPEVREIRLIISDNGIPILVMTTMREDAALFLAEKLTAAEFLRLNRDRAPINSDLIGALSLFNTDITEGLPGKKLNREWWDYRIKPSFRMFLNDPSGFFKYRAGMQGWVSLYPWSGGTFVTGLEWYPFNTVSSSNAPSSTAVRTDLVPYQQNKEVLSMLMLDQIEKFPWQIHGRLAAGLLEMQYAGIDAEVAKPFFGGRLMLGLSGSVVKKRDPDQALGLKQNDVKDRYETAFFNTRLNLPEVEGAIDLKMGQFLAGDRGMRITLSKFFNGVVLSAWYSETNTDLFTDPYNRGYHDKGISVTIPLRLFDGTDSRTVYGLGISPWTRDVAQDIEHFNTLFDYIGRNTDTYLKKDALSRDYRNAGFK